MKAKSLVFFILFLFLTACATPAMRTDLNTANTRIDEMQRVNQDIKKRLAVLEENVKGTVDVQKIMADYGAKTDQLTTDIQLLQGKLEENNFRIADLSQKLDDKSFKITELSARIDELEAKVKAMSGEAAGTSAKGSPAGKDKKSSPKSMGPSEAYRQAMNDYNSGRFDLALAGFQNYLTQFPDTTQAEQAQYWVGECYYSKKDFNKAREAFSALIKGYPKSDKVPGAKLKIGYSYLGENQVAKGKEWLRRVIKEYPESKEAKLAKSKLKKLGK